MLSLIGMAFLLSPILTSAYLLIYRNFLDEVSTRLEFKNTAFIICLFVGLASMLFKVTKDWLIHQQERKELESQKLQSELKFLKSQIDPHFFFNTLNNLYALTLKKSDLAPEIVLRLSEMMRYMLYECNELKVPLDKEIKYLQNYIELEKLRQGDNFEISFNVKGEARDKVIAPLVFIPFLENSFKHGVNNQIKSGFVNINMDLTDNDVMMSIENSKITSLNDKNLIKKSGGIGLKNVKRRLKLIYPNSHNIDIIDKANSFKVLLDIKLN
jgi:LytS/YehU family sensor histidine kinase